jgi:nucleotide-binding universal stress UspA family protein
MFHKIMVAYDESPEACRALRTAIELAKAVQAELSVVTVLEPLPLYYSFATLAQPGARWTEEKQAKAAELQSEARKQAEAAGMPISAELLSGDEVGTIISSARRHHADLLVLGLRRHTLMVGGHTAQDVAERSPCALLGVR